MELLLKTFKNRIKDRSTPKRATAKETNNIGLNEPSEGKKPIKIPPQLCDTGVHNIQFYNQISYSKSERVMRQNLSTNV